ncbi:hypothetical protein R80B4_00922 [Fibrobacteres bacterium R8-0-B4]
MAESVYVMKKSSLALIYAFVLLITFLLPRQTSARPFDWHYSRFAVPFALFYNPALLGSNPGPTVGLDMRYADTVNYDARLAVTVPLSRVLKREEYLREGANRNRKYNYANPSYMSSETTVSFGGIYSGDDDYDLNVGFATPIRMIQTGLSLCFVHRNDAAGNDIVNGTMNLGFSANVMRSGIVYFMVNNINIYNFNNMLNRGPDATNDLGFSLGTSGSPFSDTTRIFLPYDILFTYTPTGDIFTIGRLAGMLRLNLDLTYIYTNRDITGQMAIASLGYRFLRNEHGKISHNVFASVGLEFVNKASVAALAGGYGARSGNSEEVHSAFMYSSVSKAGVVTDEYLVSRIYCVSADSARVVIGMSSGGAPIHSWVLKIETHGGDNIKTFSGGNVIPASIIWDGLSSEGNKLEDDVVYAKLVIRGEKRVVESAMISMEIVNGRPKPKRDL